MSERAMDVEVVGVTRDGVRLKLDRPIGGAGGLRENPRLRKAIEEFIAEYRNALAPKGEVIRLIVDVAL